MSPKSVDYEKQRRLILPALEACQGSVQAAAAQLGWPRSTLRYWIEVLRLKDEVLRLKGRAFLDSIGPDTMC